ncbi:NUDIX domain-containing protein [Clostridium sp. D2Q-11]|uniref:8-oxo-dGTP diphosphatase n=1 Tax=Anaeromonas frigoriresistens TaxID=2683708 RepID=A0A942Z6M1_9FIRM|nr:NUDIX domain-containing protein [Anaeromonas frigoriresistens]MBS4537727.1 NUDIX domain-containing protein [Anaeromonas frigoriresistens]
MELWDVLDKNRKKTRRIVERGKPMNPGEFHLVVFAFIKNSKGQILISKRTPNKAFPNTWEITGGSAIAGEDSFRAIVREVKEELGIELTSNGRIIRSTVHEGECSYFADVWLFEQDIDIEDVICQPEEVSEAKLVSKEEIYRLFEEGIFMVGKPSIIEWLQLI